MCKGQKYHNGNMNKNLIASHIEEILLAVCAIIVVCFWYFFYPHLLLMREASQLFLCNWDYFVERITLPGGLAQYIGEFLVQFFYHPFYGALIYAILFVITQRLTKKMFPQLNVILTFLPSIILWVVALQPYIPLTTTVAVVLVMFIIVLLPKHKKIRIVCAIILLPVVYWLAGPADYYWEEEHQSTLEEMKYDLKVRQKDWKGIVALYREQPSHSPAIQHAEQLAEYYLGIISEQKLYNKELFSNQSLKSEVSSFIMDEVYFHLGLVNMSQRATFEAMESIPNHNKSGRALKRLAETSIITRQYALAQKYLDVLEESIFYRKWAIKMRPLAENPELIQQYPHYQRLQEAYDKTQDAVFY